MYTKSNISSQVVTILCIGIFALTAVPLIADDAFAGRRDGNRGRYSNEYRERDRGIEKRYRHDRRKQRTHFVSARKYRDGRWVSSRPWGYSTPRYTWRSYSYGGIFYGSPRFSFVLAGPPVGAVVVSIPLGYEKVWIDDSPYYVYGGRYYRRVPEGYLVVSPPGRAVVREYAPVVVQPSISAGGQVFVDAPVLNVRAGPSLTERRISQVEEGFILEIHGRSNGWLYVQLPNGEYGWVKAVFTRPVEPARG